jgi:hypothetical protein
MHWRNRMLAIALAGGSVAACAEEADPGVTDTVAPTSGDTTSGSTAPPLPGDSLLHDVMLGDNLRRGGYVIPPCNANPDPCCRNPDLPMCQVDAGPADAAGPEADVNDAAPPEAAPPDEGSCHGGSGTPAP